MPGIHLNSRRPERFLRQEAQETEQRVVLAGALSLGGATATAAAFRRGGSHLPTRKLRHIGLRCSNLFERCAELACRCQPFLSTGNEELLESDLIYKDSSPESLGTNTTPCTPHYATPDIPPTPISVPTHYAQHSALCDADVKAPPGCGFGPPCSQPEAPHMPRSRIHGHPSSPAESRLLPSSSSDETFCSMSPFNDAVGTFGTHEKRPPLPRHGPINGYIKIGCKGRKQAYRSSQNSPISKPSRVTELSDDGSAMKDAWSSPAVQVKLTDKSFETEIQPGDDYNMVAGGSAPSVTRPSRISCQYNRPGEIMSRFVSGSTSTVTAAIGSPQLVPPHYGYDATMDSPSRKLWEFYVHNWCPGRSLLKGTNLWRRDVAPMHRLKGVRAAVQSLAGLYVYDYQPLDKIRRLVNARYGEAEARVRDLIHDPLTAHSTERANELITISILLSMHDIVLPEGRRKRTDLNKAPVEARWKIGFELCEYLLQQTDSRLCFHDKTNIQLSSLRNSQLVMVGRGLILVQLMSKLPLHAEFDTVREAARFCWLLGGTKKDMHQIHGGCGFSKKLLHVFSEITYCAARLQLPQGLGYVPEKVKYLFKDLEEMHQWSPEFEDWDRVASRVAKRARAGKYEVADSAEMTYVTAEAWRLAAILYLQTRVLRLPRNHPEVIETLHHLAARITIMPTSGTLFTAQAPLFPVFLLAILSVEPDDKNVSEEWFDNVLRTPVRSSVPPLFASLRRIWSWIDNRIPCPTDPTIVEQVPIHKRDAWWEKMVQLVQEGELETLCLT